MAYVQNFTAVQDSTLTGVTFNDTSTGTDSNITQRRIILQLYDSSYLTNAAQPPTYINFPLTDGSTIDVTNLLTQDYAINVTMQWLDVSNAVLYTKTVLQNFYGFGAQMGYQLSQYQVSDKTLLQNRNYRQSKLNLWVSIISANNAVSFGNDITNAQLCDNDAKYYIDNPQVFY